MEQTLQSLAGILIKAIPTALILIFLHFYLRFMLFAPIRKTLKQREELTEGARKSAAASLASAELKVQEYENKLRDARAEVYKEQEETRRRWLADQSSHLGDARSQAEASLKKAKLELATEAASARQNLLETAGALADQIASSILHRRPQ